MYKKLITVFIIFTLSLFTSCKANKTATVVHELDSNYGFTSDIKISQGAESTIKKVAQIYGEQNPQIEEIKVTQEETSQKAMYLVFLKGNFNNGNLSSERLEFSMLADGTQVWALTADSWQETEVNLKNQH